MLKPGQTAAFFFMRDNHTFVNITGADLEDIIKNAKKIASENPYGMIYPAIIMEEGKEIDRIGPTAHVDSSGQVDLKEWEEFMRYNIFYPKLVNNVLSMNNRIRFLYMVLSIVGVSLLLFLIAITILIN